MRSFPFTVGIPRTSRQTCRRSPTIESVLMSRKLLCILFAIAAQCFVAVHVNAAGPVDTNPAGPSMSPEVQTDTVNAPNSAEFLDIIVTPMKETTVSDSQINDHAIALESNHEPSSVVNHESNCCTDGVLCCTPACFLPYLRDPFWITIAIVFSVWSIWLLYTYI
uniref:Transmembrane protein n=1 Tax=Spongospora subterranea TaxID=70186 RepID=A0A0H5QS56_9EUKA|eukprot:CRZ04800.1 hypothetical protein [Spongospora subterranea]